MVKVIRRKVTVDFLKNFTGKGFEKTIVTENGLPEDARMFHLAYDAITDSIDMFFFSEHGREIIEGADIFSIEPEIVCFQKIDTIDETKVKEVIDEVSDDIGDSIVEYLYEKLGVNK